MNKIINYKFLIYFLFISLLFFDFFVENSKKNFQYELSWDEVDYVNSSRFGIFENAFELKSENIVKFLKKGYQKIFHKTIINNIDKNEIKVYDYRNIDIFELRHYHPPLLIYYLNLFLDNDISLQDYKLNLAFQFIGYSLIFFLLFLALNKKNINFLNLFFLILFLIIILNSQFFQNSIGRINFHLLFSLNLLIYIFFLKKFLIKQSKKNFIRLIFFQSILFLSLETSILIYLITIFIFIYFIYYKKISLVYLLYFIITTIALTLMLWPANLYNFTFLKSYLMYFYRIFFAYESDYKNLNIFITLKNNIFENLLFYLSTLILITLNIKKILNTKIIDNIYLIYSFIYFLFIFNFAHNVTYFLPSLVLLSFYVISILINQKIIFKKYSVLIIILFLVTYDKYNNFINYKVNDIQIYNLIDTINVINLENPKILADGAHILKYYSNYKYIYNLEFYEKYNPIFYTRYNNQYYDLSSLIQKTYFDIIFISRFRNFSLNDIDYLSSLGYIYLEIDNYHFYYKKPLSLK